MIKSVEITETDVEGIDLLEVTFFEDGMDVAMYRYDSINTMLNAIKQFYQTTKGKYNV